MEHNIKVARMTESVWNKYGISQKSRKSPEVPVNRSPKESRKETALALNTPREIRLRWAGKYMYISHILRLAVLV